MSDDAQGKRKAPLSLSVVIIGGGIAGLAAAYCLGAAGHKVTVFEKSLEAKEIGAGIQISPNVSRLLKRWGLGERLKEVAVTPHGLNFYRYTGEKLNTTFVDMEATYGAPYYNLHRADLLNLLLEVATPVMTLKLGSKIAKIDSTNSSVTLESGEVVTADIILGADGIHSIARSIVTGEEAPMVSTGVAVYRANLPIDQLLNDPELKPLVETPQIHIWFGEDRHIIGYSMNAGKRFNMVMSHPDQDFSDSWTSKGNIDEMREEFVHWDPRIKKLNGMISSVLHTKIVLYPSTNEYHFKDRVVLIGDACHAMPPYGAQGAAMAIEDAAVLGNLLSHIKSLDELPSLLSAYEKIRKPRIEATIKGAWANGAMFHLKDGPQQQGRDAAIKGGKVDLAKNDVQFGYDADKVVEEWMNAGSA